LSLISVTSFLVIDAKNPTMNNKLASETEAAGPVGQLDLNQVSKKTPAIELVKPVSQRSHATTSLRELHRAYDIPYFRSRYQNSQPQTRDRIDAVLVKQYRNHFMRHVDTDKLIRLAKELRINSSIIEGFQYFNKQQQFIDSTPQRPLKTDSTVQSVNANGEFFSNNARLRSNSEGTKQTDFYNKNRLVNSVVMALLGHRSR